MYPCNPIRNNSLSNNPWAQNPSINSTFTNFTLYKNLQNGILAEQTGNVFFSNFVIAENYMAAVEFWLANFTQTPPGVFNSVIIGQSIGNQAADPINYTKSTMNAIMTGRTGQFNFSNIRIYNYPVGSLLMQTGRLNDDPLKFINLGAETFVKQFTFNGVNGAWLFMIGLKRDVIYDLDASFSSSFDGGVRNSATIVSGWPHIGAHAKCLNATISTNWDGAYMCDQSVTIRRVAFGALQVPQNFKSQLMHIYQMTDLNDSSFAPKGLLSSSFTSIGTQIMNHEP
jgi:hypothetical protein